MLRIGFSTNYFTLWDVKETTEFQRIEGLNLPYQKISYCYIQNLSMNEAEAKRKAIFKGVENFEIDFDLYGRNASFVTRKELFSKIPSDKSFFFEFGRLKGQKIQDCNDFDYLFWFFNESQNIHAKAILLENGFVEHEGQLLHGEHAKKIKLRNLVFKELEGKEEVQVEILSNIDGNNCFRFSYKNEVLWGGFQGQTKAMFYNGITYYLPVIDGKAKKIKGKIVTLKIEKNGLEADFNNKRIFQGNFQIKTDKKNELRK